MAKEGARMRADLIAPGVRATERVIEPSTPALRLRESE